MELREYQQRIADEIDKRFRGEESDRRRFVGVKLPTGGGKSFLFMDQFEKAMNEHNATTSQSDKVISDVGVRFYAPLKAILTQTRRNIAKYIIVEKYIENYKKSYEITSENIDSVLDNLSDRLLTSAGIPKTKRSDIKSKIIAIDRKGETPEEIITNVLQSSLKLITKNIEKLVKNEFPNLDMVCYQKDDKFVPITKENENNEKLLNDMLKWKKYKLIVFDEAHRTAAENWGENVTELIKDLPECKFMAITATPERDVDRIDAIEELADIGRYSPNELRNREYLASDMNLVDALTSEPPLVVKPEVVNFDCMLDKTEEYKTLKSKITKKNSTNLTILYNFLKICAICGKLDFIKENLSDKDEKLKRVIEKIKKSDRIPMEDREVLDNLSSLKDLVDQVDEVDKTNAPVTDIGKKYEEYRNEQMMAIIREHNIKNGKYVCFVPKPSTNSKKRGKGDISESKEIMEYYKELIENCIDFSNGGQALIVHSNKDVISKRESDNNLDEFVNSDGETPQIVVAMDMFNEGLHVDGVTGEFMFRQFVEREDDSQDEDKEDPRITFLQQLGRCIHSRDLDGYEEEVTPVVYDVACNFMRYNDKLKGIFKLSEGQIKFKQLYDQSMQISKGKTKNNSDKITTLPKITSLDIFFGVMQALYENGIDISNITTETTFDMLPIPEDKKEKILDDCYTISKTRVKPGYKIGLRLALAKDAFWRREKDKSLTLKVKHINGIKKMYNNQTDAFFKTISFEELHRIGFFNDIRNIDKTEIDENGFIIGGTADIDRFHGYNVKTGTKNGEIIVNRNGKKEIHIADVNGYNESGINIYTGTEYDKRFFRFDNATGKWINLHTGEDRDLLGYNHDGIKVLEDGRRRVGFDKDNFYHEQLEDGTYSRDSNGYFCKDGNGTEYDAFWFDKKNKYKGSYLTNENKFLRVSSKNGIIYEDSKTNIKFNYDGYDIEGFDQRGFNEDGINKETNCKYSIGGLDKDNNVFAKDILRKSVDSMSREELIETMVYYRAYGEQIRSNDRFKVLIDKGGLRQKFDQQIRTIENKASQILEQESAQRVAQGNLEKLRDISDKIKQQEKEIEEKKLAVSKLLSILKRQIDERDGGEAK